MTRGPNFFPQRPNFSSGLAEKFCKELATLASEKRPPGCGYFVALQQIHVKDTFLIMFNHKVVFGLGS